MKSLLTPILKEKPLYSFEEMCQLKNYAIWIIQVKFANEKMIIRNGFTMQNNI